MNQYTIEDINPITNTITVFVSCNGQTYRSFTLVSNVNDKTIITATAQALYDKFLNDVNNISKNKPVLPADVQSLIGISVLQL